jgi:hypothetical protein
MRKRYQQGSVTKSSDGRYWIGKYREDERHKTKLLGKIREITKSEARFSEIADDGLADSGREGIRFSLSPFGARDEK